MLRIVFLVALFFTLPGCVVRDFLVGPTADSDMSEDLSLIVYPKDTETGEDLDIVALKRGNRLTIVNRTPRAYHDLQIWLNQQYVGKIDHLAIGTDNVVYLNQCINEFGEPFPVGGMLNLEKSYPVVLAELVVTDVPDDGSQPALAAGKRHRMVVRMDEVSLEEASGRTSEEEIRR